MARYNRNTAYTLRQINSELEKVQNSIDTMVDREGTDPNEMLANLDMNSNRVLNLPDATNNQEPVTLSQLLNTAQFTIGQSNVKYYDTVALYQADTTLEVGDIISIKERGDALFDFISGTGTANGANIIAHGSLDGSADLRVGRVADLFNFIGAGDATDQTTGVGVWIDYLLANNVRGESWGNEYLIDVIDKAAPNGIEIYGDSTFKATGSSRLQMLRFTQVRGAANFDGLTLDGSDIVARPFELRNDGVAVTDELLGSVHIGSHFTVKNSKNLAPNTNLATGVAIVGGFTDAVFSGTVDTVDNDLTSGGDTIGVWFGFTADTSDTWIRNAKISSTAVIENVKNDNSSVEDADGVQINAPTTVTSFLTVEPGATFRECKGRAIKSQCIGNQIDSPIIYRSQYDGLFEIDLQYSGGFCRGAQIHQDGTSSNGIINVSLRTSPTTTDCNIVENKLKVTGSPATPTTSMVAVTSTDASNIMQGIVIRDNKVEGAVDYMVAPRCANVVDANRLVIDGNWAETINEAFINLTLFGAARAQLSVVFTNNGCQNGCNGSEITASGGDIIVEYARNNHGINALIANPYNLNIAAGAVTAYGAVHRVNTEGGAATDDLETINTNRTWEPDEFLTIYPNNDSNTIVVKNGVGNIVLAGSDFSMDNSRDRLVLSYDAGKSSWIEITRSDNGV